MSEIVGMRQWTGPAGCRSGKSALPDCGFLPVLWAVALMLCVTSPVFAAGEPDQSQSAIKLPLSQVKQDIEALVPDELFGDTHSDHTIHAVLAHPDDPLRRLVVVRSKGDDCHACSGAVSIFTYVQDAGQSGQWRLDKQVVPAFKSGDYGTVEGKVSWFPFQPGVYGLRIDDHGGNQGVSISVSSFYADEGRDFAELGTLITGEDLFGHNTIKDDAWASTISYEGFTRIDGADYANICSQSSGQTYSVDYQQCRMTKTAKQCAGMKEVIPIEEKTCFTFNGEQYDF